MVHSYTIQGHKNAELIISANEILKKIIQEKLKE
jgi:hypothetical protein